MGYPLAGCGGGEGRHISIAAMGWPQAYSLPASWMSSPKSIGPHGPCLLLKRSLEYSTAGRHAAYTRPGKRRTAHARGNERDILTTGRTRPILGATRKGRRAEEERSFFDGEMDATTSQRDPEGGK